MINLWDNGNELEFVSVLNANHNYLHDKMKFSNYSNCLRYFAIVSHSC